MGMEKSDNQKGILQSLDWWTIGIYLALLAFGWVSVCGASYTYGDTEIFSLSTRSGMQIVWIGTSICLGFIILMLDDRYFDTFAYVIFGLLVLLLFATIFNPHEIKRLPDRGSSWKPTIAACRVCQVCHCTRHIQTHEHLWF